MLVLQHTETETRILFRQIPVLHIQHLGVGIAAFTAAVAFTAWPDHIAKAAASKFPLLHLRHNVIAFARIAASQIALLRLCHLLHLQGPRPPIHSCCKYNIIVRRVGWG